MLLLMLNSAPAVAILAPSRLRLGNLKPIARVPWAGASGGPLQRPSFRPAQRLAVAKAARLGSGAMAATAAQPIKRRAPLGRPIRATTT
jgi:hypothetical protein